MKKVGIYIRVSTQEQAQEGYSIQAQKERLISFCKARDWNIADIYIDGGFSGSNIDRPGIQKLIEDVFLQNDVDFVSMNESFDTSTPFGRAMIGILSVFAQLEREQIKERSLMGRHERAKEGLWHGGGWLPLGYDYIDGKLVINQYEALQIKEIYDLYLQGYGVDRIAYVMNQKYTNKYASWSNHSSVSSVLDTPIYAGKITFHDEIYEGQHEAIISEELFNQVQQLRKSRSIKKEKAFQYTSLLAGFLVCAHCQARYFTKQNTGAAKYYSCYSRAKTKKIMIKDPNCKNKHWRLEKLDKKIEAELFKLAMDRSYFYKIIDKNRKKPKKVNTNKPIEKRVSDIDKQISRLMDLYQLDNMPAEEIGKRIEKLYNEKKDLQAQIVEELPDQPAADHDSVLQILDNLEIIWKYADLKAKREIIGGLIKKITMLDDKFEIEWSFV